MIHFKNLFRFLVFAGSAFLGTVIESFPQSESNEPKKIYDEFARGNIDQARSLLPGLVLKHPGNEYVMFLEASLEPDGNLAVQKYNLFLDKFPQSGLAPQALYRIYQYYYAKGLYITAQKTGRTLLEKYPNSSFESRLRGEVKDDAVEEAVTTSQTGAEEDLVISSMIYSVQVGSFRDAANAERQKFQLKDLGFPIVITEKTVDGNKFYSVLVGDFRNVDEALQCGKMLKEKFQINYRVIEKPETNK